MVAATVLVAVVFFADVFLLLDFAAHTGSGASVPAAKVTAVNSEMSLAFTSASFTLFLQHVSRRCAEPADVFSILLPFQSPVYVHVTWPYTIKV